jgi:nucleoside-diphosphate-sugar epimerase
MGDSQSAYIVDRDEPVLVTGATGFIGARVVENLVARGFRNVRCFARPHSDAAKIQERSGGRIEVVKGNLLSLEDCKSATEGVRVIFHLAAGRGEKSFADAFMNSVVTTRNLLEASLWHKCLRRFVNVSSFSVYTNGDPRRGRLLDETASEEARPERRGDAYTFAKVKQDEIVREYGAKHAIPYVIVRPGYVYGPGNPAITGRVGIGSFGVFLHLGGPNQIPFTYVDNCADAIALAGLCPGVDGEIFNVVDDDLPSSRRFLRMYKRNVRKFQSIYVPHAVSYALCWAWEKYAAWSENQLPPVYNRGKWNTFWRRTRYTNQKLKTLLGWTPRVSMEEGLRRYFESCRAVRCA